MSKRPEETAAVIHDVMVKAGDVNVAHTFAKMVRNSDGGRILDDFSPVLLDKLSAQDEKMRREAAEQDRTEQAEIDRLDEPDRQLMATLALCGYRFNRGMFYWRCIAPDNTTVDSLQPELRALIRRAEFHREERSKQ